MNFLLLQPSTQVYLVLLQNYQIIERHSLCKNLLIYLHKWLKGGEEDYRNGICQLGKCQCMKTMPAQVLHWISGDTGKGFSSRLQVELSVLSWQWRGEICQIMCGRFSFLLYLLFLNKDLINLWHTTFLFWIQTVLLLLFLLFLINQSIVSS